MAMLSLPGQSIGGQLCGKATGNCHLAGGAGLGGGCPEADNTVDIAPAQGQGFADAGGAPALDCPKAAVPR